MSLDPDCQRMHELIRVAARPPLNTLSAPDARIEMKRGRAILQPDPPQALDVRNLTCPAPAGEMALRHYRPSSAAADAPLPVLVYFHGGGWVIGDLESHDTLCRELAVHSRMAVVSVDYRLAPEDPFPAAVDDAYAATRWIAANAASLGLDPTRLAVGGDSAGGNLAIVVALMARDGGGPAIRYQLLVYPATDASMTQASHDANADVLPLTKPIMQWFWRLYTGGGEVGTDWRASPLSADSLAQLPPAYVITAGYDVLRDEGQQFADRLERAGVTVTRRHYPGQVHGFLTMGKLIREANTAVVDASRALQQALA